MRKVSLVFCVVIAGILLSCEKKQPQLSDLVAEGEVVKLTLWTDQVPDFFAAAGKEFFVAESLPGQLQVVPFENQEELQEAFIDALAEGKGPDIIVTEGDFVLHHRGKFLPLQSSPSFSVDLVRSRFVPAVAESFIEGDQMYGVGLGIDTLALLYNAEIVGAFLETDETPLFSWETLKAFSQDITRPNNSFRRFARSGVSLGRADNVHHGAEILEQMLFQAKPSLFTADGLEADLTREGLTQDGKPYRPVEEAFQFFLGFADAGSGYASWNQVFAESQSTEKNFLPFAQGDVAMVFGTASDREMIQEIIADLRQRSVASMPPEALLETFFPTFEARKVQRKVLGEVIGAGVSRLTPHPEITWRFLTFLTQSDLLRSFARISGIASSHQDILLEQQTDPGMEIFARQAKTAHAHVLPLPRESFRQGLAQRIEPVLSGRKSAQEVLGDYEKILRKQ